MQITAWLFGGQKKLKNLYTLFYKYGKPQKLYKYEVQVLTIFKNICLDWYVPDLIRSLSLWECKQKHRVYLVWKCSLLSKLSTVWISYFEESTSRSNSENPPYAKQYMLSSRPTGSHLILTMILWIKCK